MLTYVIQRTYIIQPVVNLDTVNDTTQQLHGTLVPVVNKPSHASGYTPRQDKQLQAKLGG